MGKIVLIGLGGFLGAVLRYLVGGWLQSLLKSATFPYGTLAVNLIGCLLIGLLSQMVEIRNILTSEARAFLFIGTLGAFTTFSTFGNESVTLFREGGRLLSFINVGAHILFGFTAVWLGQVSAQFIWR